MNKQEEKHLINLIQAGDNNAKRKLIEGLYPQCRYVATDYTRNGMLFDDLVQEASIGLINAVNKVKDFDSSKARFITYARKSMRNEIKKAMIEKTNTIKPSYRSIIVDKVDKIMLALTYSYDTPIGNYGTGLDFLGEWDMRSRMSLHNIFLDIFDEFLTFEQSDLIRLHYGFAHEHFDDWQKPQKALSLRVIADKYNIGVKRVRDEMDKAMIILRSDEVKYKLDGF